MISVTGDFRSFGSGSIIIATTRNKQIIGKNNVVYEVTTLLEHDAIRLFNHYAFKDETPDEHIKKLALEVVSHAKGLPLALKLWGILLHNQDTTMWREVIDMIKRESSPDIVQNLKISFEGLQDKEKTIFLDIACFFRGWRKDKTIEILESYDLGVRIRLHRLIEKSLVFISEYNTIQMHDLIQDMGRYVVKMQKDSGKPSRLWNIEDFEDVMVNNTGTVAVEAIWFPYPKKICFSEEAMKNMQRLRILHILYYSEENDGSEENNDSIVYLSNNLCWFFWQGYPWKLLPQNFNPSRLVHLNLWRSSLHHLWNETKQLRYLRRLDLRGSQSLKSTPDFNGMPNLEYLDLSECTSLEEVHHSLRCSKKLIQLNLVECVSLESFPYVNVESLESLNLNYCCNLEKFPEFIGRMKPELNIDMLYSGIRELPSSIIHPQAHLTELHLSGMNNLISLPSSICKLKCLVKLNVSECSKLESLPEGIGDLEKLEELDAEVTLISRPPSSIVRLNKLKLLTFAYRSEDRAYFVFPQVNEGLLSLEELNLSYCNLIDGGLPEDIGSLSSLKNLDLTGNNFEHLPRSIAQLGALRCLDLKECKRLKELPGFTGMSNLETLNLSCCNLVDGGLPEDIGSLSSLKNLDLRGNDFEYLPRSIAQLGALQSFDLTECKRLTQLPEFPQQLYTIEADWCNDSICNSLFQNISSLQHDISDSHSLSLRVFTSWSNDSNSLFKNFLSFSHDVSASHSVRVFSSRAENIPSWFHHQGIGRSVSVNLHENWYVSDNFLGFAVCYLDKLVDITAYLLPLCDDRLTQKLALSNHSKCPAESAIHFFLVPLAGLWDASKANGKTPNDCEVFSLVFRQMKNFGVRLLYKDEPELCIGIRRSRYEEASCSSSKKQRS